MKIKDNYAGAILMAYRLYCKFVGYINFSEFETSVNDNYNILWNEANKKRVRT